MDSLKTYQKVNRRDGKLNFGISRMEDIYTKRAGQVDEPHRHDFYTVMIVEKALGEHKLDFNTYELGASQVFFVSPGQVHQVIENEKSKGFAITFSDDFLIQNSIPSSFVSDLNLFQDYGHAPPLIASAVDFEKILHFCEEILKLFKSEQGNRLLSIGAYLKLLLIQCSNICSLSFSPQEKDKYSIVRQFKREVDEHFEKEHSASFYAKQLQVSSDHLNRSIKSKIGKTAKEYIQSRLITEAKRLLYFSDLTNKEIAYRLGFSEPANFSAFFKKCTDFSPNDFKKSLLNS